MTQFTAFDSQMMALALRLAEKGRFTTSPNPNVGCVICDSQGRIVGQGWHQKAGGPHAEVFALQEAGGHSSGGTAYVTLEPCSHTGKTPPCADALIAAGITRVVAAMVDPNPLVAGSGLRRLAEQGIAVSHGLMEAQAKRLNRGFIKRMQSGMPFVTVKLAASLDGKTALANGKSQWITGPLARQDVQRHRAASCAILTGSGTVIADNPSLNVRYNELGELRQQLVESELRQPLRIVLDGRNQLTGHYNVFEKPGPSLIINREKNQQVCPLIKQIQVNAAGNKLDLTEVIKQIGNQQVNNLWVEAGGMLAGALMQENLVDELILYQSPKLLGDKGQNLFVMEELTDLQQAKMLNWSSVRRVGDDLKMTAQVLTASN